MGLRELFKEILDSYYIHPGKSFEKSKNEKLMDIFNNKLIRGLEENISDRDFTINPYIGKKNWVKNPIIKISHKDFLGTYFYLGYIFSADLSGFYLALFNRLEWNVKERKYDYDSNNRILKVSREKLRNNFSKDVFGNLTEEIDLKNNGLPRKYVDACILAKKYENPLPSDEDLKRDLDDFIDLYMFLVNNYDSEKISTEEWISIFDSQIISPETIDLIKAINSYNGTTTQRQISNTEFENKYIDYANEEFLTTELNEDVYDISNFLSKRIIVSGFGRNNFFNCFFYGRKLNDDLEFVLFDELIEALNKMNLENLEYDLAEENDLEISDLEIEEKEKHEYMSFYEYLLEKGYFFDKETIENYLLSLKVKPFVILTGNSGTGKTKLSQLFAQYLNNPLENDSLTTEIEEDPDYIHAKVKASTIIKNSEATIKKEYLNKYLPINDYLGHFDGFIDDVPAEIGLNIVSYIRFRRSFIKEYIEPNYNDEDIIDIKIKLSDVIDFLPKPNFKGFTELQFKTGSLPKFRLRHMTTEQHVDFFNLDEKLRDCEVLIDDVSTEAKFYIYDSVVCLKSDEVDAYFEELSKKSDEHVITIKLDLDSFENLFDSIDDEEFDAVEIEEDCSTNPNYKIVPVGANWTENRHIVGYYNVITNEYQSTPAYDLIKQANKSIKPHFLILDEMNLSHVERYFADFLSAIESGEKIPLYGEEEFALPSNLFIIGTVNVDETTYMFSPKVLDRANVIEFETYSASDYMNNKIYLKSPSGNIKYLENPLEGDYIRDYGIDELKDLFKEVTVDGVSFWNILTEEIFSFQSILKESGFDFGFRVINEIVRFMAVAWEYENKPANFVNWKRYFDTCIKQKMLPKLHGSEKIIGETLQKLYKECLDSTVETEDMAKYPESYKKLKEMREVLRKQRYVSFIN